jgi:hypothetical protein
MTEGSISNVLQKVLDNLEKQTSYLKSLQFDEGKYKPRETWNFHEENFVCYEEDDSHKYPHLCHTTNPQLNNIACMLAYIIKDCCYQKFHQRIDEIQEEQKRNIKDIYIRLENLLENRYLTLNELSQFLKKGEDKGKHIETPEKLQLQLENLERLMVSLDISGKSQETSDESEDNNQIIYDFSSEEEANENENPHYVKIEEHGETSGTKRAADFEQEF